MVDRNVNRIKKGWQGKTYRRVAVSADRRSSEGIVVGVPRSRRSAIRRHVLANADPPTRLYADTFLLAFCLGLSSCALQTGTERIGAAANLDEQVWKEVEKADVVYVGETHDNPTHHRYELDLVCGLLQRKVRFAIGWEMFDKTQQGTMDAWASHAISLQTMLAKTDFPKHWGIYSPAYREILQIAAHAGVPNLALNAPPDLPRKIARGEPLTGEERAMIPTGFTGTERGYRNFVAMMGDHPGVHETDQRRFFDAQNVWDQTMASGILDFKSRNPNVLLVVLTGRGHVSGGYGIPFYVREKASLKQLILLPPL